MFQQVSARASAGGVLLYRHGNASVSFAQDDSSRTAVPKIVCFFLDGGLSHLDSFDPKPDAPSEIRGDLSAIQTTMAGVQYTEVWPHMARISHWITHLRTLQHFQNEHGFALRCMHALKQDAGGRTPSLGSVVQWQSREALPTFVSLPESVDYSGSLGTEYRGFAALGSAGRELQKDPSESASRTTSRRMLLIRTLQNSQEMEFSTKRSLSLIRQQRNVEELFRSPLFRTMLNTERLPQEMRDRFGDSNAGKLALIARNAVSCGRQFVLVNLPGWDMHTAIFSQMRRVAPSVDQAIAAFLTDLKASEDWDSTVVLIMSEFGRSPAVEPGGGRGHWPKAMSVLLAGGPIPQGCIIGNTGDKGKECKGQSHSPEDLLASLYRWMRLDWELMLPGEESRLNTSGSPIPELLL